MVYFVGVDVGTGSVRAGLFDEKGQMINICTQSIKMWNPSPNFFEQSSTDIWNSCCYVVKNITKNIDVTQIHGIGFDATCSLVVLGKNGNEDLTVSPSGEKEQNIIMWMDHRASEETNYINSINHEAFSYVGGKVSIEMQLPKLCWLKKNLPETWSNSGMFLDLPDFLTWKATGSETRSQCSVVCKWNYLAGKSGETGKVGWSQSLLQQVNLDDLLENDAKLIGSDVNFPGVAQGRGLSKQASLELGLQAGTPVGASLIDAYAGALGLLGCKTNSDIPVHQRLALICGTSTCQILVVPRPLFVEGVWGPYAHVLLPDYWLLEAGQSATGKLLDHIITSHPSYESLKMRLTQRSIHQEIDHILHSMAELRKCSSISRLTTNIHIWPDFHGNRSPLADPNLKGMISGLELDTSEENLALLYLATIQAICYGTRHIISCLREKGSEVSCMLLCGGLVQSNLFVSTLADSVQIPIVIPEQKESVLLGSAMLGASASGHFPSLQSAMEAMGGSGQTRLPNSQEYEYHDRKYQVFLKMVEHQKDYEKIMNDK